MFVYIPAGHFLGQLENYMDVHTYVRADVSSKLCQVPPSAEKSVGSCCHGILACSSRSRSTSEALYSPMAFPLQENTGHQRGTNGAPTGHQRGTNGAPNAENITNSLQNSLPNSAPHLR